MSTATAVETRLDLIRLDRIHPSPLNPRQVFRPGKLSELTRSIKEGRLIQPLVVRPKGEGRYEIVCGDRRHRALRDAGEVEADCVIRQMDDVGALVFMLSENVQREPLNPVEEATGYRKLIDKGLTQDEIAERVGLSQSAVSLKLRLLALIPELQDEVLEGGLPERKARLIARLDPQDQLPAAELSRRKHMTVEKLELLLGCRLADQAQLTFDDEDPDFDEWYRDLTGDLDYVFGPETEYRVELESLGKEFVNFHQTVCRRTSRFRDKAEHLHRLMRTRPEAFRPALEELKEKADLLRQLAEDALAALNRADDSLPRKPGCDPSSAPRQLP